MNKEEPYRDQAERLRRRIEKINDKIEDSEPMPPREQVHRQKKKTTKWKLKYPIIRILVLFFILLPIIIFSVISYLDDKKVNGIEKTNGNSVEKIHLETPKIEEKNGDDKVEKQKDTGQETVVPSDPIVTNDDSNAQVQPVNNNTPEQNAGTTNGNSSDEALNPSGSTPQTEPIPSGTTPAPKETKIIYHTVQPQETLYRIAMKYYHSNNGIETIRKANHIQNNQITAGQVLKIPIDN
jgi:LysM repeat protein